MSDHDDEFEQHRIDTLMQERHDWGHHDIEADPACWQCTGVGEDCE